MSKAYLIEIYARVIAEDKHEAETNLIDNLAWQVKHDGLMDEYDSCEAIIKTASKVSEESVTDNHHA